MRKRFLAAVACVALITSVMGAAGADQASTEVASKKDAALRELVRGQALRSARPEVHLPASKKNMKLVGKLRLTDIDDGLTDVAYLKGFAYIGAWTPNCPDGGGTHIVNVKKPKNPKEVGFAATETNAYVSEGVHALHINTADFEGDILLQDRETCPDAEVGAGGFDIYDVSTPRNPQPLALGAGDFDSDDDGVPDLTEANDYHSVMGWKQTINGVRRAFAVGVDNFELLDVDIFEITDPTNPVLIRETGGADWPAATSEGFGAQDFHHDMWVQRVDGRMEMLVAYWDVGYVRLDITDPSNPVFIDDTDVSGPDPLFPNFDPPEGNAHQAEWSKNGEFIYAADEDFAPARITEVEITDGPHAGTFPGAPVGGSAAIDILPDGVMNGPTVYGGYGCPDSAPIPPRSTVFPDPLPEGEEAIVVLQRGPTDDPSAPEEACFPGDKAAQAIEAGYDAVLLVNRHLGSAEADAGDPFCGSGAFPATPPIVAPCTSHEAFHRLFDTEPNYDLPYPPEPNTEPDIGALGARVSIESHFDGWGYMHVFDAQSLERLDSYAIREARDPDLQNVFPLSIHEVESDPRGKRLVYSAYYQGGARVFKISRRGQIREVGHFIRRGGADYWGVQPIPRGKKRPLLLFSDRHYGLHILKYTGKE